MAWVKVAEDSFADLGSGVSIADRVMDGGLKYANAYTGESAATGNGSGSIKGAAFTRIVKADGTPFKAYKMRVHITRPNRAEICQYKFWTARGFDNHQTAFTAILHANNGVNVQSVGSGVAYFETGYNNTGLAFAGEHVVTMDALTGTYNYYDSLADYQASSPYQTLTYGALLGVPVEFGFYQQASNTLISDIAVYVEDLDDGDRYVKTFDFFMSDGETAMGDGVSIDGRQFQGSADANYSGEAYYWEGDLDGDASPWITLSSYAGYAGRGGGWACMMNPANSGYQTFTGELDFASHLENRDIHYIGAFDLSNGWASRSGYQWEDRPGAIQGQSLYRFVNGTPTLMETFTSNSKGVPQKTIRTIGMRISESGTKLELLWNNEVISTFTGEANLGPFTPALGTQLNNTPFGGMMLYETYVTPDTTPPGISSIAVQQDGEDTTLLISMDEVVTGTPSGFSLTVDGEAATLSGGAIDIDEITYTVDSPPIYGTSTVLLSYTGSDIEDGAGNPLAEFSDAAVTNNSGLAAPAAGGLLSPLGFGGRKRYRYYRGRIHGLRGKGHRRHQ